MARYHVRFGYRTDDGLTYSEPTAWGECEVEAPDAAAARLAAIDLAYQNDPYRSHVRPERVTRLPEND